MNVLIKELTFSSKYYKQILLILKSAGGDARLIGGSVRDALLNKINLDIDIATNLLPEQVTEILEKNDIKVIPTGLKFGTVTALLHNEKFEITTLRNDVHCNGRHAEVIFTNNFMEDAARRDFTINALSYDSFEHKIYDYFTGIDDLKKSRVVFIGQAYDRIQEDFLRILRFFRFSCYYAKQIDPTGLKVSEQLKNGLKTLSKERIKWEMDKLIISDNAPAILQEMFNCGILQIIFPIKYYDQKSLKKASNLELYTKYSLLFYHIKQLQLVDLINIKFSKQESTKILSIVNFINQQKITEFCLKEIWLEKLDYIQYIFASTISGKLSLTTAQKFIAKYNTRLKPKFPITGYDLQKIHINDKNIGISIKHLKESWIKSDFTLDKKKLIELLKTYL